MGYKTCYVTKLCCSCPPHDLVREKQKTEATSFKLLIFHFYLLCSMGVTLNAITQQTFRRLYETHLFMVAMPTTRFSLIDGRSSQSVRHWAGVCAHTKNCLVNFYNRSGCTQVLDRGCRKTGDGKCTINVVGKVYTGNKLSLLFFSFFFYIDMTQKLPRKTELRLAY